MPRRGYGGGATSDIHKSSDIKLSKTMSWLLRHGANESGFQLQTGGFLYVTEVLSLKQLQNYTVEDVQRVVDTNEKKRFFMESHPENGKLRIRANQGHSMEVEGLELTAIEDASEFPIVIHGTFLRNWPTIQKQGLSKMKRTHIHFAPGEPGETGVISGMRAACGILIYIDIDMALKDGFKFFKSANNVILCSGNDDGILPPKYFKAVYERHPRKKLPLT